MHSLQIELSFPPRCFKNPAGTRLLLICAIAAVAGLFVIQQRVSINFFGKQAVES